MGLTMFSELEKTLAIKNLEKTKGIKLDETNLMDLEDIEDDL